MNDIGGTKESTVSREIEELRDKLVGFLPYDECKEIRAKIHAYAKANYNPTHQDKYLAFMNDNECSFDVNHPQCENRPYYFTLFTVKSQHVMGDCVEECLDKAISY
jgi:hypothetical protein